MPVPWAALKAAKPELSWEAARKEWVTSHVKEREAACIDRARERTYEYLWMKSRNLKAEAKREAEKKEDEMIDNLEQKSREVCGKLRRSIQRTMMLTILLSAESQRARKVGWHGISLLHRTCPNRSRCSRWCTTSARSLEGSYVRLNCRILLTDQAQDDIIVPFLSSFCHAPLSHHLLFFLPLSF